MTAEGSVSDYKADAQEWVRVAESKWAHYQQIVERYERGEGGLDLACRHHEYGLAKLVPHLVAVIKALTEVGEEGES